MFPIDPEVAAEAMAPRSATIGEGPIARSIWRNDQRMYTEWLLLALDAADDEQGKVYATEEPTNPF